ncbi:hypothetical protein [Sphaerotilus mobilis]|uniref:Uncharacterized protein n=1 Tax=Sphaerotilus mobilis TaxID=47994 RepID=A0A4Q7LGC8_9BURK|nr:hypothetical protein [Sphaerotilus mobilis]RZS53101.1 hypothetical protein EV685_2724 [Sphaerotilus mobilis]
MSEEWGFAAPAFKVDEALARLRRDLREAGLVERGGVFERRATAIAKVAAGVGVVEAAIVDRPSRRAPTWRARQLTSGADVRDFVTLVKKQLGAWSQDDE